MKDKINITGAILKFNIIIAMIMLCILIINLYTINSKIIYMIVNSVNMFIILQDLFINIIDNINYKHKCKEYLRRIHE